MPKALGEQARHDVERVSRICDRHLPAGNAGPTAVADLVAQKIEALTEFCRRHVPLYADAGLPRHAALHDLPVVDKSTLMLGLPRTVAEPGLDLEELRRWVPTDEREGHFMLFRDRYYVRRTSGTTGVVGFFLWDELQAAAARHAQERFITPVAYLPRPLAAVSPVIALPRFSDVLQDMHAIPLSAGLEGAVERLNRLRPASIIGSPAFTASLAEEQIAGRLRISPRAVHVWTERCLPHHRRLMVEAWGVDPAEPYGTSETSGIAVRCPEGNFHLLADHVHLELLDRGGRPVPVGGVADRVLATRLCGPVQPVLRYELGDVLVRGPDECPCGRPFPTLAGVLGRKRARLWLSTREGQPLAISAFHLVPVLEHTPGLVRYQLRYDIPGLLEVAVVGERQPVDRQRLRAALSVALRDVGADPPVISIVDGTLPEVWAAPPGSKDHHVHISVRETDVERWLADGSPRPAMPNVVRADV